MNKNIRAEENLFNKNQIAIIKQELVTKVIQLTEKQEELRTEIPELSLVRRIKPVQPKSYIQEPSICLIVQGAKRILLGKDSYIYDDNHFLITALDVPVVAEVLEATENKPYLTLILKIDPQMVSQLIIETDYSQTRPSSLNKAMTISEVTFPILNAFQRLIDLLDNSKTIPVLSPLIQKEILYRLLISEQGPHLLQIGATGSQTYQIAKAVDWLKRNFTKALKIDDLASYSQMSTSTFHHHFRNLTAMSPLQYQKWLRLQEARRLMLADHLDVASAAFKVGYESPSQFSREYCRFFEVPPSQDIKTLRKEVLIFKNKS